MEIQFTIKLLGSGGSAAVLTGQGSPGVASQHSLGNSVNDPGQTSGNANSANNAGQGGAAQDPTGPGGGGGAGLGQVIVIGPIVIGGAISSPQGAGSGGAGQDNTGPGGQG
jgi:hypothetical protein